MSDAKFSVQKTINGILEESPDVCVKKKVPFRVNKDSQKNENREQGNKTEINKKSKILTKKVNQQCWDNLATENKRNDFLSMKRKSNDNTESSLLNKISEVCNKENAGNFGIDKSGFKSVNNNNIAISININISKVSSSPNSKIDSLTNSPKQIKSKKIEKGINTENSGHEILALKKDKNINTKTEIWTQTNKTPIKNINKNTENIISVESENEMQVENKELSKQEIDIKCANLLNYQISKKSALSQKQILNELSSLKKIFDQYLPENWNSIYENTTELLPILSSLTNHKNLEIVVKALDIHDLITSKINENLFEFNKKDILKIEKLGKNNKENCIESLKNVINYIQSKEKSMDVENEENKKSKYIKKKDAEKKVSWKVNEQFSPKNNKIDKSRDSSVNSKYSQDSQESKKSLLKDVFPSKREEYKILINPEKLFRIIKDEGEEKAKIFLNGITSYTNENEIDNLTDHQAIIRKKICIKMLKFLKKLRPDCSEDFLKKIAIFFEYKYRMKDKKMGNGYLGDVKKLFVKLCKLIKENEIKEVNDTNDKK